MENYPPELRRLLDKEAIRDALMRYARGIDRHDDEIAAQAYHAGATDDHGWYVGNPAGLLDRARELHSRTSDVHHHYVMNQTIDLDGDMAHVETYYLAAMRRPEGPIDMVGGRYIDKFERRGLRWAIVNRVCLVEWTGALDKTDIATNADLFNRGTWDRTDVSYQRPLEVGRPDRDVAI
ncbi:MAG TPA: nuclear transport factor 2 family protein [Steroidobacteraceae bacterium]|jgi:hypothetical protein